MKTCERGIFELLVGFAGGNVFAQRAPQKQVPPFIVFQRVDSTRLGRHLRGTTGLAQAYIQIDVYANEYYAAKDLAASVENAIDGYTGIVYHGSDSPQQFVEICGVSLQNDVDLLDETDEPLLQRNSAVYLVTYKQ